MGITTYGDFGFLTGRQEWEISVKRRESQTMTSENFEKLISDWRSIVLFSRSRCQDCKKYAEMIRELIDTNKEDLYDVTLHEVDIANPLNLWTKQSASMKRKSWLNWKVPHVAVFRNHDPLHVSSTETLSTTKQELLDLLIRK